MLLAPKSDRFERRYRMALLSMTVHQHRLISTRCSLIHLVPLRLNSDRRSPLRNAPLLSDVPLRNQGPHARDVDECTGDLSVDSVRALVTVAENVDTLCATRHPAPYAPVSRTIRLLQSYRDRTRYIAGIILLTIILSA